MPNASSRAIRDLAEIINQLWGVATPGGRLYPAPLPREVLLIGWAEDVHGPTKTLLRQDQLSSHLDGGEWTYVAVRGVDGDENIWEFDARYELTTFPCDFLWGPGNRSDAMTWLEDEPRRGDTVGYLDRLFGVRRDTGRVYLPQRPEVILSLPEALRDGDWHVVRADFPNDALAHVRHIAAGAPCGVVGDPLTKCPVEEGSIGPWNLVVELFRSRGFQPAHYSEVCVPRRSGFPDEIGY